MQHHGRRRPASPSSREELPGLDDLVEALLALRTPDELSRFLRDLCTLAELEALAHRWQIVALLDDGLPYLDVADAQASSRPR